MIPVQFPPPQFKLKTVEGRQHIFDTIRRRWLLLTEEEWVRQNMVAYLIKTLDYPVSSLALEKEIRVNDLKKRFDILVYNKNHKPWMLIECKAPAVPLGEDVLMQVLRYQLAARAPYLVATNGSETLAWEIAGAGFFPIEQLPTWGGA